VHEPRPRRVFPPKNEEPTIRVGVILRRDNRARIAFRNGEFPFFLEARDRRLEIGAESELSAALDGERLLWFLDGLAIPDFGNATCVLRPVSQEASRVRGGISIDSVPVGRGFHWESTLSQRLLGTLSVHVTDGALEVVNHVGFEDYIACVVSSEMGTSCPEEFIKAQGVAARSWAIVFLGDKHPGRNFDVCNDDDCQRYQGATHLSANILRGLSACRGEVLLDPDAYVLPAYYAKTCGGQSEDPQDMFGFAVSGLSAVADCLDVKTCHGGYRDDNDFRRGLEDPLECFCSRNVVTEDDLAEYLGFVDKGGGHYRWHHRMTQEELVATLGSMVAHSDIVQVDDLLLGHRGASGRYCSGAIRYRRHDASLAALELPNQYSLRRALHEKFLYSTAFVAKPHRLVQGALVHIDFFGAGWGHGVGLCQVGALGRALRGASYRDILQHYYPQSKLCRVY